MLYRSNRVGFKSGRTGEKTLQAYLPETFRVAIEKETEKALAKATWAFEKYCKTTFSQRTVPVSLVLNQPYGG